MAAQDKRCLQGKLRRAIPEIETGKDDYVDFTSVVCHYWWILDR